MPFIAACDALRSAAGLSATLSPLSRRDTNTMPSVIDRRVRDGKTITHESPGNYVSLTPAVVESDPSLSPPGHHGV